MTARAASQVARAGRPAVSAGAPILAAKITAPGVPDWVVPRPRITKLIARGRRWCPLTVITAPAGAGKTMALALTPSQFTHETEGLNLVRSLLPANTPFRAWSNFEFRDGHGKWHEVDLLVLGRRRLHLVELKYYSGTLRGDDLTWRRDGHRARIPHSSSRGAKRSGWRAGCGMS